jgi:hypothetical protein
MEAKRHEPKDRDRAEAENERKRAGKGLILVVTMLPQMVTTILAQRAGKLGALTSAPLPVAWA